MSGKGRLGYPEVEQAFRPPQITQPPVAAGHLFVI